MTKTLPSCYDCAHHRRGEYGDFCVRFTRYADHLIVHGLTEAPMDLYEARLGPCGPAAKAFKRGGFFRRWFG